MRFSMQMDSNKCSTRSLDAKYPLISYAFHWPWVNLPPHQQENLTKRGSYAEASSKKLKKNLICMEKLAAQVCTPCAICQVFRIIPHQRGLLAQKGSPKPHPASFLRLSTPQLRGFSTRRIIFRLDASFLFYLAAPLLPCPFMRRFRLSSSFLSHLRPSSRVFPPSSLIFTHLHAFLCFYAPSSTLPLHLHLPLDASKTRKKVPPLAFFTPLYIPLEKHAPSIFLNLIRLAVKSFMRLPSKRLPSMFFRLAVSVFTGEPLERAVKGLPLALYRLAVKDEPLALYGRAVTQ